LKSRYPPKNPVNVLEKKNEERELNVADHRLIGQQLELFSINEEVGIGLVLWHPDGTVVRRIIRDFWEDEHLKNGYQLVCTPHIAREELWRISGHLDYYEQNMYLFEKDGEKYVVKPMNCPFHIQIFKSKPRSYRDLPIRYAEWGTVYRYERSGTLQGLLRVRGFTQDDAHIFCAPEQAKLEVLRALDFTRYMLQKFGFKEYRVHLSTRDPQHPEKYMGSEQEWNNAQEILAEALKEKNIAYQETPGEAVFYGPKIDINIVDSSIREWQCTTLQFDFNLPKRFNITFTGTDGEEHKAVMIHRALLGAIERFFAILIEHCKGNIPTWLAPTQAIVLPVSTDCVRYAERIHKRLLAHGIRVALDASTSTISYKIRQAEVRKIPYMIICGGKEAKLQRISVRKHKKGDIGLLRTEELAEKIKNESI
jgi:threonyl-tRNA synthetase